MIDELCGGTDSQQGAALAVSTFKNKFISHNDIDERYNNLAIISQSFSSPDKLKNNTNLNIIIVKSKKR